MEQKVLVAYAQYMAGTPPSPQTISTNLSPKNLLQLRNKILDDVAYTIFRGDDHALNNIVDALVDITDVYPENKFRHQTINEELITSMDTIFTYLHNGKAHFTFQDLVEDSQLVKDRDLYTETLYDKLQNLSEHLQATNLEPKTLFAKRRQTISHYLNETIHELNQLPETTKKALGYLETTRDLFLEYNHTIDLLAQEGVDVAFDADHLSHIDKIMSIWPHIITVDSTEKINELELTIIDYAENILSTKNRVMSYLTSESKRAMEPQLRQDLETIYDSETQGIGMYLNDLFHFDTQRLHLLNQHLYDQSILDLLGNNMSEYSKSLTALRISNELLVGETDTVMDKFIEGLKGMKYFLYPTSVLEEDGFIRSEGEYFSDILPEDMQSVGQSNNLEIRPRDWFLKRRELIIPQLSTVMEHLDVMQEDSVYSARELYGLTYELNHLICHDDAHYIHQKLYPDELHALRKVKKFLSEFPIYESDDLTERVEFNNFLSEIDEI